MIDPIDLEIYWNRLISIADEAGAVLKRTSFSTVVRESNDFACVLLDSKARLIAQSSLSIPGFIGTAPLSLRAMLKTIPVEALKPGDVLFTNDPWIGTGHLPDATMARPIFHNHRIIAFAMSVAHLSDIGGRQWSADANELFEEGIRFPVLKLVEAGKLNDFVVNLLMGNVRLPQQVKGDLFAQLAALSVSEQRVLELVDEYKLDSLDGVAEAILSRLSWLTGTGDAPYSRYGVDCQPLAVKPRRRDVRRLDIKRYVAVVGSAVPHRVKGVACQFGKP